MDKTWDAILRGATPYLGGYVGQIFDDSKGRFADGTTVTTSKVVSLEGDLLKTLNTVYKLED